MSDKSKSGTCLLLVAIAASNAAPPAPTIPIRAAKIILVGDSTTAVHSGWGGSFCADHVTSFLACVNLARNGRSTRSYREEGSWKLALAEAKTSGFVDTWILIQFGHNDQPGKAGRSTDLATEFPANLRRYISEARAARAHPVLLTPLTRRQFRDGKLQNDLAAWATAVAKVAAEEKVPLVDLNAMSARAVETMGPTAANGFAEVPPPPEVAAAAAMGTTIPAPKSTPATEVNSKVSPDAKESSGTSTVMPPLGHIRDEFDYTHLGHEGATYFSKMITAELAVQVPQLRPYLLP